MIIPPVRKSSQFRVFVRFDQSKKPTGDLKHHRSTDRREAGEHDLSREFDSLCDECVQPGKRIGQFR